MIDPDSANAALWIVGLCGLLLFLRWRRKRTAASLVVVADDGEPASEHDWRVYGTSAHQAELATIAGPKTEDGVRVPASALLMYDNGIPGDPTGVAVEIDGHVVGHLDRDYSAEYREAFDDNERVPALIVGGWKREGSEGHYGVRLALDL